MIPQGFTWAAGTMTGAGSDITAATHVEELLNMFAIVACFFIGSWLIVKLMSMVGESARALAGTRLYEVGLHIT